MARYNDYDPEDRGRRSSEDDRERPERSDDRGRGRRDWEEDDRRRLRDEDDYDYRPRRKPQEGSATLGVLSFLLAIGCGIVMAILFVVAGVMAMEAGGEVDENSPEAMILGFGILADLASWWSR